MSASTFTVGNLTFVTLTEVDSGWQRGLDNALSIRPEIRLVHREVYPNGCVELDYQVASLSRPGTYHDVRFIADSDGVHLSCTCELHQYRASRGYRCRHTAAVLLEQGYLSRSDMPPVKRLAHLFEDEG